MSIKRTVSLEKERKYLEWKNVNYIKLFLISSLMGDDFFDSYDRTNIVEERM